MTICEYCGGVYDLKPYPKEYAHRADLEKGRDIKRCPHCGKSVKR